MNSPSVSLKFVFLGLAAFLATASWCGYWLFVSREARAGVAAFESRLGEDGVVIECGSRSWGGFPFRIVMRCEPFSVRTTAADAAVVLARAEFLAQVYNLRHIIVVGGSPGELRRPKGLRSEISFARAVASYIGNPSDEVSILIDALRSTGPLAVEQLNLHLKRSAPPAPQFAFSLAARSASFDIPGYGAEKIDRLSAHGALTAQSPKSGQADDSVIAIRNLEMASGEILVHGKGRIGIDASARLQGRIALDVFNLRQLLDRLASRGMVPPNDIEAGLAVLTLLGEGAGGTSTIDLRAEQGRVYFGPFRLGEFPPLL
jgi:hypothetical protein